MTPYYEQDGITIYHGDCTTVLRECRPSVDLVLTDPPYGVHRKVVTSGFMQARGGQEAAAWDTVPLDDLLSQCICCGEYSIVWGFSYLANALGPCVAPMVWDKATGDNYFADGELAWTSFPTGTLRIFRHQWCGVFRASERGLAYHPTQKPEALMRWCIQQADKRSAIQTIFDPFMGSGPVLVAAKRLGRKAIGIELEERYCEVAAQRLQQGALALGA